MADHIGQQIGNYRLVRLLGEGALPKSTLENIFILAPSPPSKFSLQS